MTWPWKKRKRPVFTDAVLRKMLDNQSDIAESMVKLVGVLKAFDERATFLSETCEDMLNSIKKIHERQDTLIKLFNSYAEKINSHIEQTHG